MQISHSKCNILQISQSQTAESIHFNNIPTGLIEAWPYLATILEHLGGVDSEFSFPTVVIISQV